MGFRLSQFPRGDAVELRLDGSPVRGYSRESIAAALWVADHRVISRSLKYHRPRGLFCAAGHCGSCLARVDGVPNLRTCMIPCAEGTQIETQNAYPNRNIDAIHAVDWLFPRGFDTHSFLAGTPILGSISQKIVRALSGLGRLPDRVAEPQGGPLRLDVDVAVVGAGPSGLATATATAAAGYATVLVDENRYPGGRYVWHPKFGATHAQRAVTGAENAGVRVLTRATAIGYFAEDGPQGVLAVTTPDRLAVISARVHVYATGAYAQNLVFPGNDIPGVITVRGLARLLALEGMVPDAVVIAATSDDGAALAQALIQHGSAVTTVAPDSVVSIAGKNRVRAVRVRERGYTRVVSCDVVAVEGAVAAASELPRQHGCNVTFSPTTGFVVNASHEGRTRVRAAWVAGSVAGAQSVEAARLNGERVGAAVVADLEARS